MFCNHFLKQILSVIIISISPVISWADECDDWFSHSKIQAADSDCDLKCATLEVNVTTAVCRAWCDSYCSTSKKTNRPKQPMCITPSHWKKKINNNVVSLGNTKSIPFTQEEQDKVYKSFLGLSEALPVSELEGVYRSEKPEDPFDIFSPAAYDKNKIVLYNRAFRERADLSRIIVHELAHHLHETKLKKDFEKYKKFMGWKDGGRKGSFMDNDSKDSPEEDFANNFEAFIFEPNKLQKVIPNAYEWMNKNLKDTYKLKDCKE